MGAKAKYLREDLIQAVIKMKLQHCASQMTILNFLKNDTGMAQTTAYEIIAEAHKVIYETYKEWNKDMLENALADLEEQRESAKLSKEKKLVLEITKEINKLKGLHIQKIDHTTNGKDIGIILNIIKPDGN